MSLKHSAISSTGIHIHVDARRCMARLLALGAAGVLALVLMPAGAIAAPARPTTVEAPRPAADSTYSIEGTITGTGGSLLQGIQVEARTSYSSAAGSATTGSDGSYSVDGLSAGTYVLYFYDPSDTYLYGFYSDSGETVAYWLATGVAVTTSSVTGIDLQLKTGHHIKGTVTGTGGKPLGGILVRTFCVAGDEGPAQYCDSATTRSDGTYSLHLGTGVYTVGFIDLTGTYLTGYYSGSGFTTDRNAATGVVITTANVTGINVRMTIGLHIKGKVTGPDGQPVEGIAVLGQVDGQYYDDTSTASDGSYSLNVAPGTYTVQFQDTTGSLLNGYYSSSGFTVDKNSASPVSVTTADVTGINAQLGVGHYIRGRVTGPGGKPLQGIMVSADTPDGLYFSNSETASDGSYSVDVPVGAYLVLADDFFGLYQSGYYSTSGLAPDQGSATLVSISTSNVTGVNMALPGEVKTLAVTTTNPYGAGVAHSVTVKALDTWGNVATGYTGTIHFTSSDSAAVLPADYTFTAADKGIHKFTNGLTLKTAGSNWVRATDTGNGPVTGSQTVTVTPGAARTFGVSVAANPFAAGSAHSVTVKALDAYGNTVTGYTGTVHFSSTDSQALLPTNYTFLPGDNGSHKFTNGVTLKTAGSQSVTANDTATTSIKGSGTVTVTPGTAKTLSVSIAANPFPAGSAHSVTVKALDAYGNVATGYTGTIHFTSSDGEAVLPPGNYTFSGADAGTHKFTNGLTLNTAGSQSVTATDNSHSSITGTQTVTVSGGA